MVALIGSGMLASVALGDSCAATIRWNGVAYTGHAYLHVEARFCEIAEGDWPVVDLIERAP